jgi:hypothetical protein
MTTRSKTVLIGAAVLGLLGALRWAMVEGLPVLPGWRPPPEGTPLDRAQGAASSFLRALQAGHVELAYAATTAKFRARLDPEAFAAFVARHPALQKRHRSGRMHLAQDAFPEFRYLFAVPAASGVEQRFELVLKVQGGDWQVDELNEVP